MRYHCATSALPAFLRAVMTLSQPCVMSQSGYGESLRHAHQKMSWVNWPSFCVTVAMMATMIRFR